MFSMLEFSKESVLFILKYSKALNEDSIAQILSFWKNLIRLFIGDCGMLARLNTVLRCC